jgi:hypothetical protein
MFVSTGEETGTPRHSSVSASTTGSLHFAGGADPKGLCGRDGSIGAENRGLPPRKDVAGLVGLKASERFVTFVYM